MYILILAVLTYGSNGGNALTTAEFSNKEACEMAAIVVKNRITQYSSNSLQATCVPK